MKVDREKPPYLPKVAFVRLHTAGKEVKDYQQELKGQGFTFNQFKHMKKADELWDGLELWVSMWDYDNHESWHLWNWKKEDDNRVMLAMYEAEQYNPFCAYEDERQRRKRDTGKRKEDRRAKEVGKRKNRHCQSKQEVLQRVRQQRVAEQQEKRKPLLKRQLQTVNSIRPSVERARAQMREKNRRESKSDIV